MKNNYGKDYFDKYGHAKTQYLSDKSIAATLQRFAFDIMNFMQLRGVTIRDHIDIGCAFGLLVSEMRKYNIDSFGVDSSVYAIENAIPSARRYVSLLDITDGKKPDKKYDLATCIEVIEHIPQEYEDASIGFICECSDLVFLSSEQNADEITHVNSKPVAYWNDKFNEMGYIELGFRTTMIPWGRLYKKAQTSKELSRLYDERTQRDTRKRDNNTCVLCGKVGVQIHEIVPRSKFGANTYEQCFDIKNRASLCPDCHAIAHTNKERSRLLSVMQNKYNYQYNEQIYKAYLQE